MGTRWKQLVHLKTGKTMRDAMSEVLHERLEAGIITAINYPDMPNTYVTTQTLEQPPTQEKSLKILSPFDNVVIHRDRLSSLFGFDYTIECYVPAAKRVFGYFCLPILFGDTFVGRIDCKVHRSQQRFEVISLHIEDKTLDRDQFIPILIGELQNFADFNQCPKLDIQIIKKPSR